MEYVDVYTKLGEKTGEEMEKKLAHQRGMFHKAVHVWIVNSKGELLVQRRNKDKEIFPNLLDVSFAGHVSSGETSLEAIKREGEEEIGIDVDFEYLEYIFSYKVEAVYENLDYKDNEFDDVYLYHKDIDVNEFKFLDDEVSEVKYIDFRELEKMWKENNSELVKRDEQYAVLFYNLHKIYGGRC